jgi:NAD(P)-dependent dehydrogenase (short-subunit alcohol dehydrogenase family)
MKTALITGANKSIGFETARQLLHRGYHVYLGSRTLENGLKAVQQLNAEGLTEVETIQIDVTDQASIKAARADIGSRAASLDVLINNAGINGGMPQSALKADISAFRQVFDTNYFGVIMVTQAFIDLLQQAPQPRIVMVSSSQASLTLNNDPSYQYFSHKGAVYHPSKSALNMYTIDLAYELRDTPIKVNTVDPGFIATDFNGHRGTGTVQEAGARLVKYAVLGEDGPSGKFFSEEYNPETGEIPW